jgi:acyl-homoserine-lactone acylase
MALSFTEGSIGGDIESISLEALRAFYWSGSSGASAVGAGRERGEGSEEPSGSNGIAIAPANTSAGRALLLINPHTSFFFREVAQMTSGEGLNAYGAMTWGQFFIYQGFNERLGWMHTSSGADVIDEFAETIIRKPDGAIAYRYGTREQPVHTSRVTIRVKTTGGLTDSVFTVYRTHHGPVVRQADGKWIAVSLMQNPVDALTQSYIRTKAKALKDFRDALELHTNSSNNTVYADADGNIAYFHANFVPRRNPELDWTRPVDGSNPHNEWQGVHIVDESPNAINPPVGWVQNTNNAPWSVAGADSPRRAVFASYFDRYGENPRGIHAVRVLSGRKGFDLDRLIAAAYDSHLPAFMDLIPPLVAAWDGLGASSPAKARLKEQVELLRNWDLRWSEASVETSLAIYWGEALGRSVQKDAEGEEMGVLEFMAKRTTPAQRLGALAAATDTLTAHFGQWKTPWGDINRFQRLTGDIVQPFSDSAPSLAVGFPSAAWGTLASFGARTYPGTRRRYGTSGNSFVAVVEFGDSVRARAVTAGGVNGDPRSPHFNDQAPRYAKGQLRDVYFYPNQLEEHTERRYRPGQ